MNTSKIAALYTEHNLGFIIKFEQERPAEEGFSLARSLALVANATHRNTPDAQGYTWRMDASCMGERKTYRNEFGERCAGFIDEKIPQRVAAWVRSQLPQPELDLLNLRKELAFEQQYLITVFGYAAEDSGLDTSGYLRYGALSDFEQVLRGMAAYQRKRRKQQRKLAAQVRAYHRQQLARARYEELTTLRKGHWLGAEKALITAARVNEPTVPFLGDLNLSDEQRRALGLLYWAVPADSYMDAAFPAGTGVALKRVHRSRELVEGAVYLYQCDWSTTDATMILGRAKLADRSRGSITLHCDDRPSAFSMPLEWSNPMIKVYRVTHYTTRSAEPVAMQAETQPVQQQPAQRWRRELAHAA